MHDRPLLNNSHQPPSTRSPCLDTSLSIAAHWKIQATCSNFSTLTIESAIAAMLYIVPCPFLDTPVHCKVCATYLSHLHAMFFNFMTLAQCMVNLRSKWILTKEHKYINSGEFKAWARRALARALCCQTVLLQTFFFPLITAPVDLEVASTIWSKQLLFVYMVQGFDA